MEVTTQNGVVKVLEAETQVFVHAKKGSSARIVETGVGDSGEIHKTFFVLAEEGSSVEMISLQNFSRSTSVFWNKFSHVLRNASVSWLEVHTGGATVHSSVEDFLVEEGASATIQNISLSGDQEFHFSNSARHLAPHTRSRISARGVLGGKTKTSYRGMVYIGEGMAEADGMQEGKFLLAAPDAEIDALPSLDIGSPYARSSHALSISHLNEMSFFYPGLRGVEPYISQAMLFEGFLLAGISEESREAVQKNIREKLNSPVYVC